MASAAAINLKLLPAARTSACPVCEAIALTHVAQQTNVVGRGVWASLTCESGDAQRGFAQAEQAERAERALLLQDFSWKTLERMIFSLEGRTDE